MQDLSLALMEIITDLKNYIYEEKKFFVENTERTEETNETVNQEVNAENKLASNISSSTALLVRLPEIKNLSQAYDEQTLFSQKTNELDKLLDGLDKEKALLKLEEQAKKCYSCQQGSQRQNLVFGLGNINSPLMLIGEAPGKDEDEQGLPFVGEAGKLLIKMLSAIGISRGDVYICNVLKCRPPLNRTPESDEIEKCSVYLNKQIELIKPKVIFSMGNIPTRYLLRTSQGITRLRGGLFRVHNIIIIPTYHPSALLHNPALKKYSWHDLKLLYTYLHQENLL